MKIITFNIWDVPLWFVKKRKERILKIADYLKSLETDVICLQESFDIKNRMVLNEKFESAGYDATDKTLESRQVFFKKIDITGGLVIFSKFPIIESVFIPFNRFLNASIFEYFGRKGMLIAILDTPYGKIRVINTHLHKGNLFFDRRIRLWQIGKIFGYLRQNTESFPTVLAGDFNENSVSFKEDFFKLLEKEKFLSHRQEILEPSYRTENHYVKIWVNKVSKSKRFDYIFYRDIHTLNMASLEYHVIYPDEPLSDHDPVLLSLAEIKA